MVEVARVPAGPRVREWAKRYGFSEWMVARWIRLVPQPRTFLDGLRHRPPKYLRSNDLRASTEEVHKRLKARGFEFGRAPLDDNVLEIRHAPISPGATLEHLLGMTNLQDLASSAAPLALDAQRGEVVADMAAAPGMKTIHTAGMMQDRGSIVATEPDPERMRALAFNLERCGVTNTVLRLHDGQALPGEAWADKVLLDAPCTGEGTIPKDWARRRGEPAEVQRLAAIQDELLGAADRVLKPGGRLVYATCTFAPEENECRLQSLLERGYVMEDLPFDSCGAPLVPGVTEWPGYELDESLAKAKRFYPGIHPTLGFFVASLRKPEEEAT